MSRISTEDWQRKKWYLIRSLFDNAPLLSPIPETQEVQSEVFKSRPYSPLPDLVIEKEPNRHDEPEEYYQALEKKVMKIYKKLFIDIEKSPLSSEFENDDRYFFNSDRDLCLGTDASVEHILSDLPLNISNRSVAQDPYDFKINDELANFKKTSTESEEQLYDSGETQKSADSLKNIHRTSSELEGDVIIKTQAVVHRSGTQEIDDHINYMRIGEMQSSYTKTKDSDNSNKTKSQAEVEDDDGHSDLQFEELSISNSNKDLRFSDNEVSMSESRSTTNTSSTPDEPEHVRRQESGINSFESISAANEGRYFSAEFTADKSLDINSAREMEEAETSSSEMSVILGTTGISKLERNTRKCNGGDGHRKRPILSEISCHQNRSPIKQRKLENLAIQTSFSSSAKEINWQEIQKKFFEGIPRIYKLCSCSNHVCC